MTTQEFRDWYDAHTAAFPGILGWMKKQRGDDGKPIGEAIIRSWYSILRDVDLIPAKAASAKMSRGEIPEPAGFSAHPREIRKAAGVCEAKRVAPWDERRYDHDGEQTYSCHHCLDTGYVHCWHPVTVKKIFKQGFAADSGRPSNPLYTAVIRCSCRAGNFRPQIGESPRYDPNNQCAIGVMGFNDPGERAALLDWLRTRKAVKPQNYEPAFENTNQQQAMEY